MHTRLTPPIINYPKAWEVSATVVKMKSRIFFLFSCFDSDGGGKPDPLAGSSRCHVILLDVGTTFWVSGVSWSDRRARAAPSTWFTWQPMANAISKAAAAVLSIGIVVIVSTNGPNGKLWSETGLVLHILAMELERMLDRQVEAWCNIWSTASQVPYAARATDYESTADHWRATYP